MTKDIPIALILQEIPRVFGAMNQEEWMKTKIIQGIYFGHLNEQICIFLMSHNITVLNIKVHILL